MRLLKSVLIAPSRYDERGVAVFRVGFNPNGALLAIAGHAEDYNTRYAGRARIDYEFFDEHVRHAVTPELLRQWRDDARAAAQPFVLMLCGVQTATYPRARDIALMARREGIEVIAGGVHLSAHGPSADFLVSCGVHIGVGEVEPLWDQIIEDALDERLLPIYRIRPGQGVRVKSATSYMEAPDIGDVPFPYLPPGERSRYLNSAQHFIDSSRGCPFICTFCVVKNVFGRTVRSRDPERLVAWMVDRVRNDGIRHFFFTDDNFVRSPRHVELLNLLQVAQRQGPQFSLWLFVDIESTCYAGEDSPRGERTREFLRLCESAGVVEVYIGLESTNDAVLREMHKGVNRDKDDVHGTAGVEDAQEARRRLVQRYKAGVQAWHSIGVSVECGYILGFDADGYGAGRQAAHDFTEIGVDFATFYLLAPLPGAEDFARASGQSRLILKDFNEYFTGQPALAHPSLSPADIEAELQGAVRSYWSWPTVLRRIAGGALGVGRRRVKTPWNYAKRQLGFKFMMGSRLYTYVEGGLFHRRGAMIARREVISDEEARSFYLGSKAPLSSGLAAGLRDDSTMESLPILAPTLTEDEGRLRIAS